MTRTIKGSLTTYGHIAGVLMTDSVIPRIPGDPGHAQTFPLPVLDAAAVGFPFQDLVDARKDRLDILVKAAQSLEAKGARFIVADCGLFSPFQKDIAGQLNIPYRQFDRLFHIGFCNDTI